MNRKHLRRLPLEGSPNTRELGGYPCVGGGSTRWGVFLRSSSPHGMTPADLQYVSDYGVTTTVDLRSEEERTANPSRLESDERFAGFHVSMSDQIHSVNFEGDMPGTMSGLYINLLDNSRADIARVVRILAEGEEGCLFHCAVGKDRTGVIAMLLLGLAGVADADIVADYVVTEIYIRELMETSLAAMTERDIPTHVLRSIPESMWRVLQHLHETYGSAREYLLGAGLSGERLDGLCAKLVEP